MTTGTIRSKEAKQVVGDLLASRGVSKAIYKITGRELHMLAARDKRQIDLEDVIARASA